jgi:hypothetical protein
MQALDEIKAYLLHSIGKSAFCAAQGLKRPLSTYNNVLVCHFHLVLSALVGRLG